MVIVTIIQLGRESKCPLGKKIFPFNRKKKINILSVFKYSKKAPGGNDLD